MDLDQPSYFVGLMTTKYSSLSEAMTNAPDDISSHLARSKEFHERGAFSWVAHFWIALRNQSVPWPSSEIATRLKNLSVVTPSS